MCGPPSIASLWYFCTFSTWVETYQLWNLQTEYHKLYMTKVKSSICYHNSKNGLSYRLSWSQNCQKNERALCYNKLYICFFYKKGTFFFNTWVHFSSNKTVSETVTTTYWDKWSRCKNSLELLFGIPKCKVFSYDGINVVKRGWYVTTRATPVSFILGLSNNSSKHFSETLLSWVSTTFCGYHLIQNQVFKVFLES